MGLTFVLNQDGGGDTAVQSVVNQSTIVPASNTTTQDQTTTTTTTNTTSESEVTTTTTISKEPFIYFEGLEDNQTPDPVERPDLIAELYERFPWTEELLGGPLSEGGRRCYSFLFGGDRKWGTTGTLAEKFYVFKGADDKIYLWLSLTLPHSLDALFRVCGMSLEDLLINMVSDGPSAFLPGGEPDLVWAKRLATFSSGKVSNELGRHKVGWLSAILKKLEAEFKPTKKQNQEQA